MGLRIHRGTLSPVPALVLLLSGCNQSRPPVGTPQGPRGASRSTSATDLAQVSLARLHLTLDVPATGECAQEPSRGTFPSRVRWYVWGVPHGDSSATRLISVAIDSDGSLVSYTDRGKDHLVRIVPRAQFGLTVAAYADSGAVEARSSPDSLLAFQSLGPPSGIIRAVLSGCRG